MLDLRRRFHGGANFWCFFNSAIKRRPKSFGAPTGRRNGSSAPTCIGVARDSV
jgi:hypothetical protein